jgi:integrase
LKGYAVEVKVRVKGVKRYRARGKWFYYHRATGTRLRSPPNSPAFIAEVRALNAGETPPRKRDPEARRRIYRPGTWGALASAYRASPEFTQLADRTRADYDKVLNWLAALDDVPLAQITPAACLGFRDEAFRQKKRRFANYVVHMLSVVLGWGKPRGHVAENAAHGVAKIVKPRGAPEANRAWSDEECEIVLEAAKGPLKVAIALGMFAGARGGDVVRIAWGHYTGQEIEWRQGR